MTELNCEFSLSHSPFLAAYLVRTRPWDRETPSVYPASPLGNARPSPHTRWESDKKWTVENTFRPKGSGTPFAAALGGHCSPASSCHQPYPTFSGAQEGELREPWLLPQAGCMRSPWPSMKPLRPCGLRHLCASIPFPRPSPHLGSSLSSYLL